MKVKRLSTTAILPHKAHTGDLGYDLFANEAVTLPPHTLRIVSTGIAIQFPPRYGAMIRDRSSVATKKHLFTVAGIIDNGYIGEIKIAMYNSNGYNEFISQGDKIAQLVLIPTVNFGVEEVDEITSPDQRKDSGFGSTGGYRDFPWGSLTGNNLKENEK